MSKMDKTSGLENATKPLLLNQNNEYSFSKYKFPECFQNIDLIFKIAGFTWHTRDDISKSWIIWSWVFRVLIVTHLIFLFRNSDANTLLYYADTGQFFIDGALISTTVIFAFSGLVPQIFCTYYLANGYIQKSLNELLSMSIVDENKIPHIMSTLQKHSKFPIQFIVAVSLFQGCGWVTVNYLLNTDNDFGTIIGNIFWPLGWSFCVWFPLLTGIGVSMIALDILCLRQELYISAIIETDHYARTNHNDKLLNTFYLKTSNIFKRKKMCHVKVIKNLSQVCIEYQKITDTIIYESNLWKYYLFLFLVTFVMSIWAAVAILVNIGEQSNKIAAFAHIIMLPIAYLVVAFVLLYRISKLNDFTKDSLKLISASCFSIENINIQPAKISRILSMIEYNGCYFEIFGFVINFERVTAVFVALIATGFTAISHYVFNRLGWVD